MTTDATLSAITTTRQEASSTAWFWWKETRQLAPLVVLLIIVAMLIVVLNSLVGLMNDGTFNVQLPYEVTMLVFPGLFATGAGPLLVGQERAQRTLDWLALLPISARRLATTKLCVALVGLVVMWAFAFFIVAVFDLGKPGTSHWRIGQRPGYSDNPFSYPVWLTHSLFILLSGFYVAWKIKNQFYSLIALIPLAFAPLIMTTLVSAIIDRRLMAGELDWINFVFTVLGILVVTPLTYRAAINTLGPDTAPPVRPLLGVSPYSPAQETNDSISPIFGTQTGPIIWQSIHSARGMLTILIAMLLVSFFAAMPMAVENYNRGIFEFLPFLLLPAPLAVCWLGISVFKHDGASQQIRFLADRGVSPTKTYFAIHAVPTAILSTALVVYGLWNMTLSHRSAVSGFASGLPSLATMMLFVVVIYGISQWTSQFVRTLILSVILAPILSIIVAGWLIFAYGAMGVPAYGLVICALAPFAATLFLMPRYMDSCDRPAALMAGIFVIAFIAFVPVGFAAAHVLSIPTINPKLRQQLTAEAEQLKPETTFVQLSLSGLYIRGEYLDGIDRNAERVQQLEHDLAYYLLDPQQLIKPLTSKLASTDDVSAHIYEWDYRRWHGGLIRARIMWRQDPTDANWSELESWLDASAILLPALRRSTFISDQEMADRLEVVMIDTLRNEIPADRRDEDSVDQAIGSLGTPASRSAARRRAVLSTWRHRFQDSEGRYLYHHIYQLEHQPQGLLPWVEPRLYESLVMALLEGIESTENKSADDGWRRKLHEIHQTGGVFETSRYGDEMRSKSAIKTMSLGPVNGYGQLWGREWEYVDPTTLASN